MRQYWRQALTVLASLVAWSSGASSQSQVLTRGDRVLIKLKVDSVLVDTARVGEDGTTIMPRLGPLHLGALTLGSVGDSVRRAYARIFSVVAVEVSPLVRVTALGEFRRPGVYFIDPGSEIRDLVAAAGGLTDIARESRVILVRGKTRSPIKSWLSSSLVSFELQSGDAVVAERESWLRRNTFTFVSAVSVLTSIILALSR